MSEDIRVGDRFLLGVKVETVAPHAAIMIRVPGHGSIWIERDELLAAKRLPRAIKVGDRVRALVAREWVWVGSVVAVKGTRAWVDWDEYGESLRDFSELTLVEPAS